MYYHKPYRGKQLRRDNHWSVRGLVAAYVMNEGMGDKVHDLSGNTNVGILSSGVVWDSGRAGKAVYLNGTTGYITANPQRGFNGHGTVSMWLKRDDPSRTEYIFDHTGHDFLCYLTSDGLDFFPNHGGDSEDKLQIDNISWDTDWHQVVITADDETNKLEAFFDGQSKGSSSPFWTAASIPDWVFGVSGLSVEFLFKGFIDSVYIHSRVLSAGEIQQTYRDPSSMFARPNLARLYVEVAPPGIVPLAMDHYRRMRVA